MSTLIPAAALDLFALRENFDHERILLCFNGPITSALIEEIGNALRSHLRVLKESPSAVTDVFSAYVEMTQNIRRYVEQKPHIQDASVIVVSRDGQGRHMVSAGNTVEVADGERLVARIHELAALSKEQLKALYKTQLRRPREELEGSAGLGFIDIARKAAEPLHCTLRPLDSDRAFFTLRVTL
ncbi:MAG: biofilm regulation protein kinase SiaB [Burkholderiaceae bacterium]|nr:biofilm regulation protein kinase SiaB [Burkholderiaceae bacterium]